MPHPESRVELPQRVTLVSRTADSLRQAIQRGEWKVTLPSARSLALLLQVSWTTVRKALKILQHEGLIASSQGAAAKIVKKRRNVSRPNKVIFLAPVRTPEVSRTNAYAHAELAHRLHIANFEVQYIYDVRLWEDVHARRIDQIVKHSDAACWVLFYSNHAQQEYFASRGLSAFIVGHRYPDIALPFMDINLEAVARHATTQLLTRGHRRLALLLPEVTDAGMVAREAGFKAAVDSFSGQGARGFVLRHHRGNNIPEVLDSSLRKSSPPTGFIVADPWNTISAISHLTHTGLRVPEDVSLIGMDFEFVLHAHHPCICTYWMDYEAYAVRLGRLVVRLAKTGAFSLKPNWFFPAFRANETLAPPPPG